MKEIYRVVAETWDGTRETHYVRATDPMLAQEHINQKHNPRNIPRIEEVEVANATIEVASVETA